MAAVTLTQAEAQAVLDRYLAGESIRSLARGTGVGYKRILRQLVDVGAYDADRHRSRYTPEQKQEMVDRYEAGESIRAIGRAYGCTGQNVRDLLVRRNVQLRPPGTPGPDESVLTLVRERREAGISHQKISEELGVTPVTVRSWCRMLGLPRDPRQGGAAHHSWKGGKVTTKNGYVNVWADPTDPIDRALAQRSNYIPEHRLVMSKAIGRPLTPRETVHHINGNKTDNRLENLQLRQGNHGKGARAVCLDCGSHNVGHDPI